MTEVVTEETEVVVIGAGPAGLAVGACLGQAGIPFLILEKEPILAASWHRHYERLHLHTDRARSALPFLPFPRRYPRYPSRLQVIQYLQSYARHFGLEPRFGQEVLAARRTDASSSSGGRRWETRTVDGIFRSRHIVNASGLNSVPHLPSWPGLDDFRGKVMHSSEYRSGAAFEGQTVLVVGFGNSGGEIALDLHEHRAKPIIAVRGTVNIIPRELFGLPILAIVIPLSRLPGHLADVLTAPILRLLYGHLRRFRVRPARYGPFVQVARRGRIPLIDVGTLDLIERGQIRVRGEIARFLEEKVLFAEGQLEEVNSVVLATGYRPGYPRFLDIAEPLPRGGASAGSPHPHPHTPGLHFCGFKVVATGVLREIAREAQQIAANISSSHGGGDAHTKQSGPADMRRD